MTSAEAPAPAEGARLAFFALLFPIAGVFAGPAKAIAQDPGDARVRVEVRDLDTREPIVGAHVTIPDLYLFWVTDATGTASVGPVPARSYRLEITHADYLEVSTGVELGGGMNPQTDIYLTARPVEIAGVTASVSQADARARYSAKLDRNGFYQRAAQGRGTHLDRTAIERKHAFVTSDIFRSVSPMRVIQDSFGRGILSGGPRCGGSLNPSAMDVLEATQWAGDYVIGPTLYVDGVEWSGGVDDLSVDWIEAIEVYIGASEVPAQYSRTSEECGVILIWTQ
jgi:hypothetical protein